MNSDLFKTMSNFYQVKNACHKYILGFTFKGAVYAVTVSAEDIANYMKLDKASRGKGYSLRFKPTTAQKMSLLKDSQAICSVEFFLDTVSTTIYNRGEIFEKLVTELNGQTWVKDSLPFWEGPDPEINGIGYQLKFEGATYMTESQMYRLMEEA
jgi:hypothetical protein